MTTHHGTIPLIKRLITEFMAPYKTGFILAIICMIVTAATTALQAWLMQPVLDELFMNKNTLMLIWLPITVLAISVLRGFSSYGNIFLMRKVGQSILTDLQKGLYRHLVHADLALFHTHNAGRLLSRLTNDITLLRNSVSNLLTGFVRETITLTFLLGVMCYQSWQLSIITFVVFPLAIVPITRLGRRMRGVSHHIQQEMAEFANHLEQTFQGIRMVKAYNQETREADHTDSIMTALLRHYVKSAKIEAAVSPIMESLAGVAIALIIWYGGSQVIEGNTTPGAFFSFITALIMAYKPLKSLSVISTSLQEGVAAAERYFSLKDIQTEIIDKPNAQALSIRGGEICFDQVSFHYNTPETPAVENVSFTIPAGKTVALVGPSGSGKSTLVNLLLRFYDVESGTITLDNQSISDVTLHSLRSHIALVSQDIVLFDASIYDNIAYGNPDAPKEAIYDAARKAAAHDFIEALPEGYHTMIGAQGAKLSGGQRQRIAIARALLKNAPILILDEATSALDTVSEQRIQDALDILKQNRTTLIIAHRLSTIKDANIIMVLSKGKIVESGTHDHLLKQKGHYFELYMTQPSEADDLSSKEPNGE